MKQKLERCGACGAFQSDPREYTEEEQANAELMQCCPGNYDDYTPRYVTRDMAIDAGDVSLEGSAY
jgi:hypothetical protein